MGGLSVRLDSLKLRLRLWQAAFSFFFFFFLFSFLLSRVLEKCNYCSCIVHWTVAVNVDFSIVNSASVHCLRIHKFHFSVTFLLKMGPTVLFTHLKIILLQCFQFSVFSFSKISSIQTDPKHDKLCIKLYTVNLDARDISYEI